MELLGGLMYPVRLFGMELELCQQGFALLALVPIWLYRGRQGCHSKPFQYGKRSIITRQGQKKKHLGHEVQKIR